jgi:glycosyltransferase A (GT-A) superfamily protein (DUF2064 family)
MADPAGIALLVIAKAPLPGAVKTRLCPPCTHDQAAALAEAALLDTLDTVARTPAARRVLVFDGGAAPDDARRVARERADDPDRHYGRQSLGLRWCPAGFELIWQRGEGLAARLAAAFADVGAPALLIGMDTPQLTPELLLEGMSALARTSVDAVLGPSPDGGYWSIGLKGNAYAVFSGIPMSEPFTFAAQRRRIEHLGMALHEQPHLLDVDTIADARTVARQAPGIRFSQALATVERAGSRPAERLAAGGPGQRAVAAVPAELA